MIFYYDRILVNEGIDIETYEHDDDLINESLSKRCNGFRLLLLIKIILTIKKELAIDVIKSY